MEQTIIVTKEDIKRGRGERLAREARATDAPARVTVEGRCSKAPAHFFLVFVPTTDGWTVDRVQSASAATSATSQAMELTGQIGWSGYTGCPHCHKVSVVKCGRCARLTCASRETMQGKALFRCAWCGHEGYVAGVIQSLAGSQSKGAK